MNVHSYVRTYICTYVVTYIHTYVRTYVRMYVCKVKNVGSERGGGTDQKKKCIWRFAR